MRQTWDEQRPNQAAILAYIAREASGAVRPSIGMAARWIRPWNSFTRFCIRWSLDNLPDDREQNGKADSDEPHVKHDPTGDVLRVDGWTHGRG